jgi:hypothetical protein
MSRTKKIKFETKLIFDSADLQGAMLHFFDTYRENLPPFLQDALAKAGIKSDPAMIIGDKEIRFQLTDTNKGLVFIYTDDKKNHLKTIDYKLVPNDESYIKIENAQLIVFFKRGGAPDDKVAMFPTLGDAVKGLKSVPDPVVVQAEIDRIDERDKDRTEEVLADVAKIQEKKKEDKKPTKKAKMEVVK